MYYVIQASMTLATQYLHILRRSSGRRPPMLAAESNSALGSFLHRMACVRFFFIDSYREMMLMVLFAARDVYRMSILSPRKCYWGVCVCPLRSVFRYNLY